MSEEGPLGGSDGLSSDLPHELRQEIVTTRLSDLEAYGTLVRLGQSAEHFSERCWSTAATTAFAAAAKVLRTLASAAYRANLKNYMEEEEP